MTTSACCIKLHWTGGDLGVDVVLDCSGVYSRAEGEAYLAAGAKKVLFAHPGGNDLDAAIVFGVRTTIHSSMNDQQVIDVYHQDLRRIRAASQSIVPVDTKLGRLASRASFRSFVIVLKRATCVCRRST